MRILRIYIVLLLISSKMGLGQDATFTLIDHNPLSTNPAFALPSNGQVQFMTLSRQQWWNLPGATSRSAAYHMNQASFLYPFISTREHGLGFGIQLNRNSSGEGRLAMTDVVTYTASRTRIKKNIYMDAGVGIGMKQYAIDWDQLTFTSQLDPFYGVVNSFPLVNPRNGNSSVSISGNAGVLLSAMSKNRRNQYKLGTGIYHINRPGVSFFDETERINRRFSIHGTYIVFRPPSRGVIGKIGTSYYVFKHNFQYQFPLSTAETRVGTNINGILTIYSGLRRRNYLITNTSSDALMWSIQMNTPAFMISVGYDFTISDLNIQRTRGTTEIALTIPLGASRNIRSRRASEPCYVDYLLTHSEWKAVEQFNKKSTYWGREYSPVTFIR